MTKTDSCMSGRLSADGSARARLVPETTGVGDDIVCKWHPAPGGLTEPQKQGKIVYS